MCCDGVIMMLLWCCVGVIRMLLWCDGGIMGILCCPCGRMVLLGSLGWGYDGVISAFVMVL